MSAPCPTLCFIVTMRADERAPVDELRRLLDDFAQLLDGHGLSVTSQGVEHLIGRDGSQATDNDRSLIRNWAQHWASVADIDVGDIIAVSRGG